MYYWQWLGHYNTLAEFRELLLQYYRGVSYSRYADEPDESPESRRARVQINRMSTRVLTAMLMTIGPPRVTHIPAPAVGGLVTQIPVFSNLFGLHHYDIGPDIVLGFVDQALGDLEDRRTGSLLYTLNPVNWIFSVLQAVFHIPFRLLKVAGLDGDSVESSWIGKLLKLAMMILALVEGLKQTGLWEQVLGFLQTPP